MCNYGYYSLFTYTNNIALKDQTMQQKQPTGQLQESVQNVVAQAQQEVQSSRQPWYLATKRARFFIIFYLIEFVLFALLAWFVRYNPIIPVDITITHEFQESKAPGLQLFMIAISYLGYHMEIFIPLIVLTALAFWLVRLRLEAVYIVALSAVSSGLNVLIKLLIARPRPTSQFVTIFQSASGQSFPSGHVMSYVAFFGLLFSLGIILFKRDRWWNYILLIVPAFFVVMVGPSRIYLGDHWASDVLGGYLFGGFLLGVSLWLYLYLKSKGVLTPKLKRGETAVEPQPAPSHT